MARSLDELLQDGAWAEARIETRRDDDQILVVTGSVDSAGKKMRLHRQLASLEAQRILNCVSIHPACSGEVLLENVRSALLEHPQLPQRCIMAEVFDRTVLLRGSVTSEWSRILASEVVRSIDEVADIINVLSVAPPRVEQDLEVCSRIEERFDACGLLESCILHPVVVGRHVGVSGFVAGRIQKHRVYQILNEAAPQIGAGKVQLRLVCASA